MSGRARAAAQVHEEAIPHVERREGSREEALLEYGCEEPVDLLVQGVSSDPRDVQSGEARAVADVLIGEHTEGCEACRKSGYVHVGRGLPTFTRESAARQSAAWLALCLTGKQAFITSWRALGLGLPEYAQC